MPSLAQKQAKRDKIIRYLQTHGGAVESSSGRASAPLLKASGYSSPGPLNLLFKELEEEGVIERVIRGKRTFRIGLIAQPLRRMTEDRPYNGDEPQDSDQLFVAETSEITDLLREIRDELRGIKNSRRSLFSRS